jgi:hypothetical protein
MSTPNYTPPIRVMHKVTTPSGGEDVVASLEEAVNLICEDTGYEVNLVHGTGIVYEIHAATNSSSRIGSCGMIGRYRTEREAIDALHAETQRDDRCPFNSVIAYTLIQLEVFTDGHNTRVPSSDISSNRLHALKRLSAHMPPSIVWDAE